MNFNIYNSHRNFENQFTPYFRSNAIDKKENNKGNTHTQNNLNKTLLIGLPVVAIGGLASYRYSSKFQKFIEKILNSLKSSSTKSKPQTTASKAESDATKKLEELNKKIKEAEEKLQKLAKKEKELDERENKLKEQKINPQNENRTKEKIVYVTQDNTEELQQIKQERAILAEQKAELDKSRKDLLEEQNRFASQKIQREEVSKRQKDDIRAQQGLINLNEQAINEQIQHLARLEKLMKKMQRAVDNLQSKKGCIESANQNLTQIFYSYLEGISKLKKEYETILKDKNISKGQLDELIPKLNKLREEFIETAQDNDALSSVVSRLRDEANDLTIKNDTATEILNKTEHRQKIAAKVLHALRAKLRVLFNEQEDLSLKNTEQRINATKLKKENKQLQSSNKMGRTTLSRLNQTITAYQQMVNELMYKVFGLENYSDYLTKKIQNKLQELNKAKADTDDCRKALTKSIEELEKETQEKENLTSEIVNLKKQKDTLSADNKSIQQTKEQLEKEIQEKTATIAKKETQIKQIKEQIEEASSEYNKTLNKLKFINQDFSKLSRENTRLDKQNQSLESNIATLSSKQHILERDYFEMSDQFESVSAKLSSRNVDLEQAESKKDSLIKEIKDLEEKLNKLNLQKTKADKDFTLNELEQKLTTTKIELDAKKAELNEITTSIATSKKDQALLTEKIKKLNEQIIEQQATYTEKNRELAKIEEETQKAQAKLSETEQELQNAQNKLKDVETQTSQKTSMLTKLKNKLLKTGKMLGVQRKKLHTVQNTTISEIKSLKSRIREFRKSILIFVNQNEIMHKTYDNNQRLIYRQNKILQEVEAQINNLEKYLDDLENQISQKKISKTEYDKKIAELKEQYEELEKNTKLSESKLADTNSAIKTAEQELQNAQNKLKNIEDQTKVKSEELTNLSGDIQKLNNEKSTLEGQLNEIRKNKVEIEREIQTLQEKKTSVIEQKVDTKTDATTTNTTRAELDAKIEKKRAELSTLEQKQKEAQSLFDGLTEKYIKKDEALDNLRNEAKNLQQKIETLTAEQNTLNATNTNMQNSIKEATLKLESLQSEITTQQNTLNALDLVASNVRLETEKAKELLSRLDGYALERAKKIEEGNNILAEIDKLIKDKKIDLKTITDLEEYLEKLQKTVKSLEAEKQSLESSNILLRADNANLSNQRIVQLGITANNGKTILDLSTIINKLKTELSELKSKLEVKQQNSQQISTPTMVEGHKPQIKTDRVDEPKVQAKTAKTTKSNTLQDEHSTTEKTLDSQRNATKDAEMPYIETRCVRPSAFKSMFRILTGRDPGLIFEERLPNGKWKKRRSKRR